MYLSENVTRLHNLKESLQPHQHTYMRVFTSNLYDLWL